MTVRVLLAEDQAMVRGALAALLSLEKDVEIVAEVSRGDEVIPVALDVLPDVALLDIEMPGGDGLTAAGELRERLSSCRVIILTTFGRAGYLRRAMESGAVGFLLKDAPASELVTAIRRRWPSNGWWTLAWPRRHLARARTRSPSASARCLPPRRAGRPSET
jgi:two-component system, NarL family, response regulator DesR